MAIKWIKTPHKGLRYHEHPTRKHGRQRDRYYAVRFKVDGKDYEYGIGWMSDGVPESIKAESPEMGFTDYCLMLMRQYKGNIKTGQGPRSPREQREIIARQEEEKRQRQQEADEQAKQESNTLALIFEEHYLPYARNNKKSRSCDTEEHLFRNWIKPVVGGKVPKDVSAFDCERIKKRMRDAGKSERTIEYALAVLRQFFTVAGKLKLYSGPNPLKEVDKPKFDNRKQRFLTKEETTLLMDELKTRSRQLYQIAMISLHSGLRFGEIAALTWQDVDISRGLFLLRDTKNTETRYGFMTEALKRELMTLTPGEPSELIFKDKTGGKIKSISATFDRVVDSLGLNTGIQDRRMRFTFHGLRHTFASNLVSIGVDLFRVQQLLGHKTPKMTLRYSHMRPDDLRSAIDQMERAMGQSKSSEVITLKS
ncbi:MAG: site-specific integrase [Desulfobacterales bacterium]|nr:site-specific integrase [Desulfobacterales bacterium]MDD4463373.1 site-specific integrase [Desulfobacterales bacterium]